MSSTGATHEEDSQCHACDETSPIKYSPNSLPSLVWEYLLRKHYDNKESVPVFDISRNR